MTIGQRCGVLPPRRLVTTLVFVLVTAFLTALTAGGHRAEADTGASCTGTYSIGWQSPSKTPATFGATVTVKNTSPYRISTWTIRWTFTAGQQITEGTPYSADAVQTGTAVTARPLGPYNAILAPGASTTWGFHGTYDGKSNPVPSISCAGPSQGSSHATLSTSLEPLGVNTASWDRDFTAPSIARDLASAKVGLVRYPGGSWADEYFWQTNTAKSEKQPVDFAAFSQQVKALGGQKFVTVNYGSDTPQSAAAWVKESQKSGQGVTLWELGNELYGSWENDTHPNPHTATSYATNGLPYLKAMKEADPKARICYDYAMDGSLAPGSGVENWQNWNATVLKAAAEYYDCADVHWYPINGISEPQTTQSIMQLIDNIPTAAAQVKHTLDQYDPTSFFVVGETNMSQTQNEWNQQTVGGLFAAANTLEWLSYGAQSVQWWDVHNYGTQTADFGMFSSAGDGQPAMNTPFPPYYGFAMASHLAVKGATVGTLLLPNPDIYSFSAQLPDGSYAVLLVNANPSQATALKVSDLGFTGTPRTRYLYDKTHPTIATQAFTGSTVSVPSESIVVLTDSEGAPPTPTPTSTPIPSESPTPTPTPGESSTPTPTPVPGSCSASYSLTNSWSGGFTGEVTVAAGSTAISGWRVTLVLPQGTSITNLWNGSPSGTDRTVTVTNAGHNGALPAGASTSFGFQGTGSGAGVTATCSAG